MKHATFLPLIAICSLAACNQKTGSTTITTNAQTGEVTTSGSGDAANALRLQPGKWEMKVQVSDLKMANMPKGVGANPPLASTTACITPEQVEKGPAELLKNANMNCTATRSTYAGGKIEGEVTCKMPGGGSMHSKTTGFYTATSLTSDATVDITGAQAMSQKVHTEGRRIGECGAK